MVTKANQLWLGNERGWRGARGGEYKGAWENLQVMGLFTILIVVMVSQVYAYIHIHQIVYIKYVKLLYILIIPQLKLLK